MSQPGIELFRSAGQIALTREYVQHEAEGIRMQWIARNGFDAPPTWLEDVFRDLGTGRFWGVFNKLDGHGRVDSQEVQDSKRELAQNTLSAVEMSQIFILCVKAALDRSIEDFRPGKYMGHDILYNEIYGKKGSYLSSFATDEVRKGLINGSFWELLADMKTGINRGYSAYRIRDILENDYEALDIEFVPLGITFFEKFERIDPQNIFELDGLTNEQVDKYLSFIKKIDTNRQRLGISRDRVASLVGPYAACLLQFEGEPGDKKPRFKDYAKRIKDPWLVEFINGFEFVKEVLAYHLRMIGSNRNMGRFDFVARVLDLMPEPTVIFELIAKRLGYSYELGYWVRISKEYKIDIEKYFGEVANTMYQEHLAFLKENKPKRRKSSKK